MNFSGVIEPNLVSIRNVLQMTGIDFYCMKSLKSLLDYLIFHIFFTTQSYFPFAI